MRARIEFFSDIHCPYAYLTAYRLRRLLPEYEDRVEVVPRSLAIEYDTKRPTPKRIVDHETPFLMLEEPDIPYQPWGAPDSTWPVTSLPGFEAIECAKRQSHEHAWALDWEIRRAFFADNRCISMRHVLLELAEQVGLDVDRFRDDFDNGVCRRAVIDDTHHGWYELDMDVSPTLVLPDGTLVANPGNPVVAMDPARHMKVTRLVPPEDGPRGMDAIRQAFERALKAVDA